MKTLLTLARNKLLIAFMKRPETGMSFEIRTPIHGIIRVSLREELGLDLHSLVRFFTDFTIFDQFRRITPISRY